MKQATRLGASLMGNRRCRFELWAPSARSVAVKLTGPDRRTAQMSPTACGYFTVEVDDVPAGARYVYQLQYPDGGIRERPDPASRHQPEGVHGPSRVVSPKFRWTDRGWCGLPLSRYVLYELHVGAFTPEGTFDAVAEHLDGLRRLGITAVELMPVAQFPGGRNWGYDGVYPFAVQDSYGGPDGLKRLVDACHCSGLAVVLDVVYNHLGPEGNYLRDFGPYFTDFYQTPWGEAVNFDGPHSNEVRRYFIENALQWIDEFRIDALRLDAVHAILDFSARPFLEELGAAVHARAEKLNRRIHLIAESALNDTRVIRPRELGGFNLDAQWNDDYHHSLRVALTGEQSGYYRDFNGLEHLGRAWRDGYVYCGQYSEFRQRNHGNPSRNVPARQLVVFAQNHDQVGNRMLGDRLSATVAFEKQKLAAAAVLLSPFVPLIFMGEEYGETAPFAYFVSHSDPDLVQAVREGRRREFDAFDWQGEPPDPQDEKTYLSCKLNRALLDKEPHRTMFEFYRELIALRRGTPALAHPSKKNTAVSIDRHRSVLLAERRLGDETVCLLFNFGSRPGPTAVDLPEGRWLKRLDSADPRWMGPGSGVPETVRVSGTRRLDAAPHSVVALSKGSGSGDRD